MAEYTWGDLPKGSTDAQLISEAITQAITDHNNDPDAHLGEGQSLQSHKASEIIDHEAESIIADKIAEGQISLLHISQTRQFIPVPLSGIKLDTAAPNSFTHATYAEIATGPTTNTWYTAYTGGDEQYTLLGAASKSPHFRMRLVPTLLTSMQAYFGIGDFLGDSALGFKIDGTVLKAVWWDNTAAEHLITLTGIDPSVPHNYEVSLTDGVGIEWKVDGEVVNTLTWESDIACEGGNLGLTFSIRRTNSTPKVLVLYQVMLEQDYI